MAAMPKGHTVPTVRRPNFDYESGDVPRAYFRNSMILTQLLNNFSASATPLEGFFIRDAMSYLAKIDDPLLKRQVAHFAQQESHHSAEHKAANRFLKERLGVPVEIAEELLGEMLKQIEGDENEQFRMALVLTGEHLLGEFGHLILELGIVDDVAEPFRSLFRWHAYEEFEHNCIAIDGYYHIYGNTWPSYLVRLRAFWFFLTKFRPIQQSMPRRLQEAMGEPFGLKERWELFKFNFLSPGFNIHMLRRTVTLLSPWFHPRKVRNVDTALEQYRNVVDRAWEVRRPSA